MDQDGRPVALNSPVKRNPDTGSFQIRAKDQADLDRLSAREMRKIEAAGKKITSSESKEVSEKPSVQVTHQIDLDTWERMAVKATLGLLAKTQPPSWRLSESANMLCRQLRHTTGKAVAMRAADMYHAFAPEPASTVNVITIAKRPVAGVSLLGIFAIYLELAPDMKGVDVTWVSDPLQPSASVCGTFAQVIAEHLSIGRSWMMFLFVPRVARRLHMSTDRPRHTENGTQERSRERVCARLSLVPKIANAVEDPRSSISACPRAVTGSSHMGLVPSSVTTCRGRQYTHRANAV